MKIIILGAGQVGRTAAYHLAREEANDVTVVDVDDEVLRDLQDRLDIRTVRGNAASPRTLEQAGAAAADMLVALTNSDEVNVVACHVAWTLYRTPTRIARIRSPDFTSRTELFISPQDGSPPNGSGFAVDMYVSPEQLVTTYIRRLIRYPGALQIVDFAGGRVRLAARGGERHRLPTERRAPVPARRRRCARRRHEGRARRAADARGVDRVPGAAASLRRARARWRGPAGDRARARAGTRRSACCLSGSR